jgi:hypothetical protein
VGLLIGIDKFYRLLREIQKYGRLVLQMLYSLLISIKDVPPFSRSYTQHQ